MRLPVQSAHVTRSTRAMPSHIGINAAFVAIPVVLRPGICYDDRIGFYPCPFATPWWLSALL
jgi:hypothetical protein